MTTFSAVHVVVAGSHGRLALAASRLLTARGGQVFGLTRSPEQADDVQAAGAHPILLDLATATVEQFAERLADADAVPCTTGTDLGASGQAGPIDRDGPHPRGRSATHGTALRSCSPP
ncbi:NAD(P)H-binding protein [Streptomyces sp. NBC_01363]|uniref:NAD(P)H-binding protein n=1 Tax=Streptomyces sp. NBC_01363 TaxID=2903840 RepID=UPI00338D6C7A